MVCKFNKTLNVLCISAVLYKKAGVGIVRIVFLRIVGITVKIAVVRAGKISAEEVNIIFLRVICRLYGLIQNEIRLVEFDLWGAARSKQEGRYEDKNSAEKTFHDNSLKAVPINKIYLYSNRLKILCIYTL